MLSIKQKKIFLVINTVKIQLFTLSLQNSLDQKELDFTDHSHRKYRCSGMQKCYPSALFTNLTYYEILLCGFKFIFAS